MPQVYLIISPPAKNFLRQKGRGDQLLCELGNVLVHAVEMVFGIAGKNDTAFTAVLAEATLHEASIQVEVRYTAGEDEYGLGPFDPTRDEQKLVVNRIKEVFADWARTNKMGHCWRTLSVWCKPHYNSYFEMAQRL